jgi:hypothetical protein
MARLTNRVDVTLGADDQHTTRDRGCGHANLVHRILRKQLKLFASADDKDLSVLVREVQAAVRGYG